MVHLFPPEASAPYKQNKTNKKVAEVIRIMFCEVFHYNKGNYINTNK